MDTIEKFKILCLQYKEAILEQDDVKIEKSVDALMKIRKQLHIEHNLLELIQFLEFDDEWIKKAAATWLLPLEEKKSIKALETLKKSKDSFISDTSSFVLEYWKKGALDWLYKY